MPQSISSVTIPSPSPRNPGHLIKNHSHELGFVHINCPKGGGGGGEGDLTGAGNLQKFDIRGLFLPKVAFLVSIQSMKQNLLSVWGQTIIFLLGGYFCGKKTVHSCSWLKKFVCFKVIHVEGKIICKAKEIF